MFEERNIDKDFINRFKKEHKIENKYILLCLGRIAKEKSNDVLLEGYANYLKNHNRDDSVLLVVGDGPDKENLEK